jgi:cysteine-rich repeat protein
MRNLLIFAAATALVAGCGDNLDNSIPVVCGDGILAGDEACDDGNTASKDGCNAGCVVEHGFACAGTPSVCTSRCGDGLIGGTETCDDGNTVPGDGCDATCAIEHGSACTGEPSTCASTCGDGVVAGDEECDDHNTAALDGCDATCHKEPGWVCTGEPSTCAATCGDGLISGGEACDDHNTANGDGCDDNCAVEHGFACAGAPSVCASTCGDGIRASNEACDDHNLIEDDGCDSACAIEHGYTCASEPSACASACGDGIVAGNEQCDDHNVLSLDGCDATCHVEHGFACGAAEPSPCASSCGDGVVASNEQCDDHNTTSLDGCSSTCHTETGWTCAGDPTACSAICGDGLVVGPEACDDGNTTSFDGCSSTCYVDLFNEAEPNNTVAQANGPYTPDVRIRARIVAPNDVDVFAIKLTATTDLSIETFDLDGIGVCNNADTRIALLAPDGTTVLASDDDGGLGRCSKLAPDTAPVAHLPAGTYYVRVESFGNDQLIPGYNLVVRALARCGDGQLAGAEQCDGGPGCTATCDRTATCGDGFVDGTEQCDDHNAIANDGCSPGCAWEARTEVEPNDAVASATGPFTLPKLLAGAINAPGDADYYHLRLTATSDIAAETFDGLGIGHCSGIDTTLSLYNATGGLILARDQGGLGDCAKIDPARAADAAARHLPPGEYYLAVRDYRDDGVIPGYTVLVTTPAVCGDGVISGAEQCDGGAGCASTCDRVPTCGDGFVDGSEQCDDHNTAAGDGCGATCQLELVTEVEANDTAATANPVAATALIGAAIEPKGDNDYFAITLTATSDLTISTNRAGQACNFDTEIFFYAPDGTTQLATNDDAGGTTCSALTPTADAAMRHLAPGTYFLRVHEFGDDVALPDYRVHVAATSTCGNGVVEGSEECDGGAGCTATCDRVPTCGDGYVDAPETCDDGNTAAGDGCDATCAIEALAEIEPNDDTASADAAALVLGATTATVTGAIGAVGDHDVVKLVVAASGVYRFETASGPGACTIATTIELLDSTGAVLYTDTNSGIATCSALRLYLTAGTYYVRVSQRGNTATIAAYWLTVGALTATTTEFEPNDTRATANVLPAADGYILGSHLVTGDLDYVAVTVPPGKGIRAEVIEGSAAETCESNDIDSTLTLFDATGVVLGKDDDSGRGLCSMIDGTGATPAHPFASHLGGVYYLAVDASPFAQNQLSTAAEFDYRLVVEVR